MGWEGGGGVGGWVGGGLLEGWETRWAWCTCGSVQGSGYKIGEEKREVGEPVWPSGKALGW